MAYPRGHQGSYNQEVTKDPTTSKELQASPASVKISVHDSVRKRPDKNSLMALLSTKNSKSSHVDLHDLWLNNPLWNDDTAA